MALPLDAAITMTVSGLLTLGIFSFPFWPMNLGFRITESIYLGVSIGWMVAAQAWILYQLLLPVIQGKDYLILGAVALGMLLYTTYHSEYRWLSRYGTIVAMGTLLAVGLRTQPIGMFKRVLAVSKPLDSISNIWIVMAFVTTLVYFIFTIHGGKPGTAGNKALDYIRRLGRIMMVMYLAAAFVGWGSKRFSLIGYRVAWTVQTWIFQLFGI
jgi:hypothetical protein